MKTIGFLILSSLIAAMAITSCSEVAQTTSKELQACNFRTGDLRRSFCRVSLYRVLAEPEAFYGKPIFTYGYLQTGPGTAMGLAPSPASFNANDTIGCVQITSHHLSPSDPPQSISREGVYAVIVAGDFSAPEDDICSGRLSNATIMDARWIEP